MKINIANTAIATPQDSSIKLNINPPEDPNLIRIEIVDPNVDKLIFSIQARRALNGDIMIFDHKDIDIVVMDQQKKIVAFAKDLMSEVVYGAESRLMEHLRKFGVIEYDSIQGGNVYGSLEGKIHESKDLDAIKMSLFQISQWMDTEKPAMEALEAHDDMFDDSLTTPDVENSTDLGEIPHGEEKGSIKKHGMFSPYYYGRYTY
ncbi:MAG: hypothetical protein CMF94_01325 [Candidatus Marinimicrobia bacterium]|nr:hypothetical protein [Candidatus Neomarinimicrobiota bacterium]